MIRFYDKAAWLLSSLGIALLVLSVVLVPSQAALGDTGEEELGPSCWLCGNACGAWPTCPGWCTGSGCASCWCLPSLVQCGCMW
jgi:hypothetical protein